MIYIDRLFFQQFTPGCEAVKSTLDDLMTNLRAGLGLCRFKRLALADFRVTPDQLVALFLANVIIAFVIGYVENLPTPEFNSYAVTEEGFSASALLLATYLVARFVLHREIAIALAILILSANPALVVIWEILELGVLQHVDTVSGYWLAYVAYLVWVLAVVFWCIRTVTGGVSLRVTGAFATLLLIWIVPLWLLGISGEYWYANGSDSQEEDPYKAYRDLDAERMLFSQPKLLEQTLARLAPQRPGVPDIYFVGVGAYARQDVFLKETLYARDLFDRRFDAAGRSVTLINHLTTREDLPLASATNLEATLRHIGTVMNPEEDILILYMTSHGSHKHELSMNFWPLPLNDVTPAMLRNYLDAAGIKWRVIMISACYSGGFVQPLSTPQTAIATAAAPDKMSFGCSNENDFTYFGEALLKDQLQREYSFPVAFAQATAAIAERETREALSASNPQFVVGEDIAPVLDALSRQLQALDVALP